MDPKEADEIESSADLTQTAHLEAMCFRSAKQLDLCLQFLLKPLCPNTENFYGIFISKAFIQIQ